MGTVPGGDAPAATAAELQELEQARHEYTGLWSLEHVPGGRHPWRATRSEDEIAARRLVFTSIRAVTLEGLRDGIRATEWIDTGDAGR